MTIANRRVKLEIVTYLGSSWTLKITSDYDCSHEIRRRLLLGRKAIKKKLDGVLKIRDVTLLANVCIVKAMVFPVSCFIVRACQ